MVRVLAIFMALALAVGIAILTAGLLFFMPQSVEVSQPRPPEFHVYAASRENSPAPMVVEVEPMVVEVERPAVVTAEDPIDARFSELAAVANAEAARRVMAQQEASGNEAMRAAEERMRRQQEEMDRVHMSQTRKSSFIFFGVVLAIPFLFIFGIVILLLIFRSRSKRAAAPGGRAGCATAAETETTQELHRLQQRLAERVEALEIILMDKFEKRNDPS